MTDWKRKLAAFLHDPPSKCLDIRTHGERSDAAFRQAGFTDEAEAGEYYKTADHVGASADRLPFPSSRAAQLSCAFDGIRNAFVHPLSSGKTAFHSEFKSVEEGFDGEKSVQPALSDASLASLGDEDEKWRARFFVHWRLWSLRASEKDYRFSLLPADTRIPDHTVWTHMQVVSALAGCVDDKQVWRPSFLRFQLGPVQDFIAAARSTRDLWSGSYLLSWLMAAGLKALSAEAGPDAVIFPNLLGQPLFDLHWKKDLWDKVSINDQFSLWKNVNWDLDSLRTPNLPNVFLAVVPSSEGSMLAEKVERAICEEWRRIADSAWAACEEAGLKIKENESKEEAYQRKEKFDRQIDQFLSISWSVTEWPDSLEKTIDLASGFADEMPVTEAAERVKVIKKMAEEWMPKDHRDGRFYEGGSKGPKRKLNNIGLGWSVILAYNQWQLDAVRQTRIFPANRDGGWDVGLLNNKDSLTGREEAVAGGRVWKQLAEGIQQGPWKSLFKHDDWIGGPTLVKRVWHIAYLNQTPWNLETDSKAFKMPNTRGIAKGDPDWGDDEDLETAADEEKYFAVLALDGDEIGKWISGEKTPLFRHQLASYKDGSGNSAGAMEYFERESNPDDGDKNLKGRFETFLNSNRALSPSYHLQFSQALGHFALRCARKIVEAYKGRLIYAGGDDVLALLPSDLALRCAESLRKALRGESVCGPDGSVIFKSTTPGFLEEPGFKDDSGRSIPILVPGPKADCSAGIAIAHFKSPLQDVVRAAQAAEKCAKRKSSDGGLNRKAIAVTLMKRSGEIIQWGAKWDGGLGLYRRMAKALSGEILSSRFPHQFAALLEPYVTNSSGLMSQIPADQRTDTFPVEEIIQQEFAHCISRQRGKHFPTDKEETQSLVDNFKNELDVYLHTLDEAGIKSADAKLKSVIGLCQTVAFAHRTSVRDDS